jgi:hypothetical protein
MVNLLLLIVPAAFLGTAAFRLLRSRMDPHPRRGDIVLLSFIACFCLLSAAGLVLAFAGLFSPITVALSLTAAGAAAWAGSRTPAEISVESEGAGRGLFLVGLSALVIGGLIFYLRPGENVMGNWDPGVYLAQGSALAEGGSYRLEDRASPELTPAEKRSIYGLQRGWPVKYPGFFVSFRESHSLDPQFYPLYPLWSAIFTLAGGISAALLLSGLCSLLSLVLLVKIGERIMGQTAALLAGLLFLFNPVQIWFSGFQTAEMLLQFLFLAGLWCWSLWLRGGGRAPSLLAGLCFSLAMFSSVTAVYAAGLAGGAHLSQARGRRGAWYFFLPFLLFLPLLVLQNLFFTRQYLVQVVRILSPVPRAAPLYLLALVAAFFLAYFLGPKIAPPAGGHTRKAAGAALSVTAAAAILLLALALYGGDSGVSGVRVLSSMVSKSNLLLAAAGFGLFLWKEPRLGAALGTLALLYTLPFLTKMTIVEMYPWAFKRYLAVTLPLLCLFTGWFWSRALSLAGRRSFQVLLLAAMIALSARPLYRGRDFAFVRDWKGGVSFVGKVADSLPPEGVVIAKKWIATPLEFLHHRKVVPLYLPRGAGSLPTVYVDLISRLRREGKEVFFVLQKAGRPSLPFDLLPVHGESLDTSVLVQSAAPFSGETRRRDLTVEVLRVP